MTQYLKYIYGLPNDRKTYYATNVGENVPIRKKDKNMYLCHLYDVHCSKLLSFPRF
jgi:hypothetical protein